MAVSSALESSAATAAKGTKQSSSRMDFMAVPSDAGHSTPRRLTGLLDSTVTVPRRGLEFRPVGSGTWIRMNTSLANASKHDGVMVLELNAPPANTYSYEMM